MDESENDKIAKRRELRRRKILEQAKSRLQQLQENTDAPTKEYVERHYPDPEIFPNDHTPDYSSAALPQNSENLQTIQKTKPFFIQTKAHTFLLSLMLYVLTIQFENGKYPISLYLPVLLCTIFEILFYPNGKVMELDPMIESVIKICGLKFAKITPILLVISRYVKLLLYLAAEIGAILFFYSLISIVVSSLFTTANLAKLN